MYVERLRNLVVVKCKHFDCYAKTYPREHIQLTKNEMDIYVNMTIVDDTHKDIKLTLTRRLQLVDELLQKLTFKDSDNKFTNVYLSKDQFDKLIVESKVKCKLFALDGSVLFGTKKCDLVTRKSYIGFVNSILKEYEIRIKLNKSNKKVRNNVITSYSYFIEHLL